MISTSEKAATVSEREGSASLPPTINPILASWQRLLTEAPDTPTCYGLDGQAMLSRYELDAKAVAIQKQLHGLPAGSIVAVAAANQPAWPALFLASLRTGVALMPLEAGHALLQNAPWMQRMQISLMATLEKGEFSIAWSKAIEISGWPDGKNPDLLKVTSGTTSQPRAVRFRSSQLWHDVDQILRDMRLLPEDRNLAVISFAHSYGFSSLVLPLLTAGIPFVMAENPLPATLSLACQTGGATVFPGVPAMFRALTASDAIRDLEPLRLCISAGAPLPPETAGTFSAKFGLPIQVFYGSSECGGIAYDNRPEAGLEAGIVGKPMRHVNLDFESTPGPSPITISGPTVGDGYFPWDEDDGEVLREGRFKPSDLVELRPEGLGLAGRLDDLINVAGRKLNPLEVELAIVGSGAAEEAVVFGCGRPGRETQIVAAVVGALPGDAEFRRRCAGRLSAWMIPDRIWRMHRIPANTRGKVSRKELARQFAEASEHWPT